MNPPKFPVAQTGWIDISRPISAEIPVWPGDRPFSLDQTVDAGMVLSSFSTTCHVGSHVDAPKHLNSNSGGVESIPLERLIGRAEIVAARATDEVVELGHLPEAWRPNAERILVRTDSYPLNMPVGKGFCGLSTALVHWLADRHVTLVGLDTPSVDVFASDDLPVHKALAERGMTWIEGLWMEAAPPGIYTLMALPMPLVGVEKKVYTVIFFALE